MMQKKSGYLLFVVLIVMSSACSALTDQDMLTAQETLVESALPTAALPAVECPTGTIVATVEPGKAPEFTPAAPETALTADPGLSNKLIRGCERGGPAKEHPQEGEAAIEFTLLDVDGNPYTLSELLKGKPVVLVFGSFT